MISTKKIKEEPTNKIDEIYQALIKLENDERIAVMDKLIKWLGDKAKNGIYKDRE